jgi:hypothetical protein
LTIGFVYDIKHGKEATMKKRNGPYTPVGPTISRKDKKRMGELFVNICAPILPMVRPALEKCVKQLLSRNMVLSLTLKEVLGSVGASIAQQGMPAADRRKVMRQVERFLNRLPASTEVTRDMIEDESRGIVRIWMNAILLYSSDDKSFDLKYLDDAMLPPGFSEADLDRYCDAGLLLDGQSVREILRQVKLGLPDGKCLPDAAVELIRLHGVKIKE